MGNAQSYARVNFEEVQGFISNDSNGMLKDVYLINTLDMTKQNCVIKNTINANEEEELINKLLRQDNSRPIILYGKNHSDPTIIKKYNQLKTLGFKNVKVYIGGLFEWLCLQDIYGSSLFPTNGIENDILKYK